MKKVLYIAWNDVRIEFSSRWTLVFFLVLPLVFTAILGTAMASVYEGDSGADTRFPVLVVDEDGSALSEELGRVLRASGVIRPIFEPLKQGLEMFDAGDAPALLTIPAGFGQALLAGQQAEVSLRTAANDNRVLAIEQAIDAASSQVGNAVAATQASVAAAENIRAFEGDAARQAYFEESLAMAERVLGTLPARVEATQSPQVTTDIGSSFDQSSAGQLVTWVLITLIGASEVFVAERLAGTLRRLLVTPTSKGTILSGKIVGRLGMGIVQMAILIGFGALVFKVNWGRSPAALVLIVLAFGLSAVALGVLLATFARSPGQASGLTVLFSMLLAALGGAWWPLEITPAIYQKVVQILPTTWAMKGFDDVIVRGEGLAGILPEAGILLGFAVLFFVAGIWRLRYE